MAAMTNPWLFILAVAAFFTLGAGALGAGATWLSIGVITAVIALGLAAVQRMIRDAVDDLTRENVTD